MLTLISCNSQSSVSDASDEINTNSKLKAASDFFAMEKTKVMVVGTFHFEYPNLDALKVEDKDKVDVLSDSRQKEMHELIQYIKKFKPTKIGVESFESLNFTNELRDYQNGKIKLKRDERHQLGVRIADELQLDTIYSLDAGSFANDLQRKDVKWFEEIWEDYDWNSDDHIDGLKRNWFAYKNEILKESTLLEYLKYINTKESHEYGYGTYFTGDFRLGESRGADALSIYWYNRNLRIFRKIQNIVESPEERILVIFGNGHAALLRQFLEYSPEFEFVEFGSLD